MEDFNEEENNICEEITHQRLKIVITGKRADGSKYSDGLPANLKYFKTGFVSKSSKNLTLMGWLTMRICY